MQNFMFGNFDPDEAIRERLRAMSGGWLIIAWLLLSTLPSIRKTFKDIHFEHGLRHSADRTHNTSCELLAVPCRAPCPVPRALCPVPVPEPLSLDSRALAPIRPEWPFTTYFFFISVTLPLTLYRLNISPIKFRDIWCVVRESTRFSASPSTSPPRPTDRPPQPACGHCRPRAAYACAGAFAFVFASARLAIESWCLRFREPSAPEPFFFFFEDFLPPTSSPRARAIFPTSSPCPFRRPPRAFRTSSLRARALFPTSSSVPLDVFVPVPPDVFVPVPPDVFVPVPP
ncbi:hypothetical protein TYRP_021231 [Tyrophagus putrescentiae]|nr:hypothetical protein TYRP_021231 [Tyrophagus putrescentiae]